MEGLIFIDTHVVVWLYSGRLELFSNRALEQIQNNDLCISPIVKLELGYLYETGRIIRPPDKIINSLSKEIGLKLSNDDFNQVITEAIKLNWTRDPFDRIITAQALIKKSPLITKDRSILSNYKLAFWE